MKRAFVLLVAMCAVCMQVSPLCARGFSLGSAYHMSDRASYLGAALAANLNTWNNDKVAFRGVVSYFSGTIQPDDTADRPSERVEVGLEGKNTMIKGGSLFNVMDIGYAFVRSDIEGDTDWDGGFI